MIGPIGVFLSEKVNNSGTNQLSALLKNILGKQRHARPAAWAKIGPEKCEQEKKEHRPDQSY